MATRQNFEVKLATVWTFTIDVGDASGAALQPTDVKVRIADFDRTTLYFDLSLAGGVRITQLGGRWLATVTVTEAMQAAAGILAGVYRYDVEALLPDGSDVDQVEGVIDVADNLFADFP